jgi:hypothetical protein
MNATRRARAEQVIRNGGIAWVTTHEGRKFALVPSGRGQARYKVTKNTCDCAGFTFYGYCRHHDGIMLKLERRTRGAA